MPAKFIDELDDPEGKVPFLEGILYPEPELSGKLVEAAREVFSQWGANLAGMERAIEEARGVGGDVGQGAAAIGENVSEAAGILPGLGLGGEANELGALTGQPERAQQAVESGVSEIKEPPPASTFSASEYEFEWQMSEWGLIERKDYGSDWPEGAHDFPGRRESEVPGPVARRLREEAEEARREAGGGGGAAAPGGGAGPQGQEPGGEQPETTQRGGGRGGQ